MPDAIDLYHFQLAAAARTADAINANKKSSKNNKDTAPSTMILGLHGGPAMAPDKSLGRFANRFPIICMSTMLVDVGIRRGPFSNFRPLEKCGQE
jgi:hypothetical protein